MKQLSEITHPELVAALAKPGQDIIDSLTPQKAHLWHMASCLPGEVAELVEGISPYILGMLNSPDRENLLEELGDIAFYFEGLWQGLDMLPPPYTPTPEFRRKHIAELTMNLVIAAGQVFDVIKKFVIYNKPFDHDGTTNALHKFGHSAADLRGFANLTQEEVTRANIAKLSKRYESLTYSDKSAQERADKSDTFPLRLICAHQSIPQGTVFRITESDWNGATDKIQVLWGTSIYDIPRNNFETIKT